MSRVKASKAVCTYYANLDSNRESPDSRATKVRSGRKSRKRRAVYSKIRSSIESIFKVKVVDDESQPTQRIATRNSTSPNPRTTKARTKKEKV